MNEKHKAFALKAPFPWFGGKSRVSHIVWDYFGDVRNYVEPFFGSGAVLVGRPTEPKIETVNDLDCFIACFWRSLKNDPEGVAYWADSPVNECDLHANHLWLVSQKDFRERMRTDPDYYDVKIAGRWVNGICQWIGSGWCAEQLPHLGDAGKGVHRNLPHLGNEGTDVHRNLPRNRPHLGHEGMGVHRKVTNADGSLSEQTGHGVHASGLSRKLPHLSDNGPGTGVHRGGIVDGGLYAWFYALADRLRRVRVCCGDWSRVLGPSPTTHIGTTGVFLDPPYAVDERSEVYGEDSRDIAHDVRAWAIANGDNPELRIALCGYEAPDYAMPPSWTEVAWRANGGYANQAGKMQGPANATRERIWFSPHCHHPQSMLFTQDLCERASHAEIKDAIL